MTVTMMTVLMMLTMVSYQTAPRNQQVSFSHWLHENCTYGAWCRGGWGEVRYRRLIKLIRSSTKALRYSYSEIWLLVVLRDPAEWDTFMHTNLNTKLNAENLSLRRLLLSTVLTHQFVCSITWLELFEHDTSKVVSWRQRTVCRCEKSCAL